MLCEAGLSAIDTIVLPAMSWCIQGTAEDRFRMKIRVYSVSGLISSGNEATQNNSSFTAHPCPKEMGVFLIFFFALFYLYRPFIPGGVEPLPILARADGLIVLPEGSARKISVGESPLD